MRSLTTTAAAAAAYNWPLPAETDADTQAWLTSHPDKDSWRDDFDRDGFVVVKDLLDSPDQIKAYQDMYDAFLDNTIDARAHRHDLGITEEDEVKEEDAPDTEAVTQIMWPSLYVEQLLTAAAHKRSLAVTIFLYNDPDTEFSMDFDMAISKTTDTKTPIHSDAAYWPEGMPDTRALSCWLALDHAVADNGCMQFVPGSHLKPLVDHQPVRPGVHTLTAVDAVTLEAQAVPQPLEPGSATFHCGGTLHFTKGNTTDSQRRAFITNCRPTSMVEWERANGFDHGRGGVETFERETVTVA